MRRQFEEEPDEDPDEPDEESEARPVPTSMPSVGTGGREYEYRTEAISLPELADGHSLAERLSAASAEGWDHVEIVAAGDVHVLLQRRPKRQAREPRPVGFRAGS
jgi:hypothetical protein